MHQLIALLTLSAFGASIGLIVWTLLALPGASERQAEEERAEHPAVARWVQLLVLLAAPLTELLEREPASGRFHLLQPVFATFERQLKSAGLSAELRPAQVLIMMPLAALFGLFLGIVAFVLFPARILILLFTLGGFLLPLLWLRDQVARRQDDIRRALPFAIDLMTLMTEAGLDFTIALDRISRKLGPHPLGHELRLTQREIQMGKNRSAAMRHLAERVNLVDLSAVCASIIQADELGSGFAPALRVQADQIRTSRAQEIEKKALEAPVKILFPLIVFFFPVTFVIIFGPVFLSYLR